MRRGRGFTVFDLVFSLGLLVLLMAGVIATLVSLRHHENRIRCAANLRMFGVALLQYAEENGDRLPPRPFGSDAPNWLTTVSKELALPQGQSIMRCPDCVYVQVKGSGYAMLEPFLGTRIEKRSAAMKLLLTESAGPPVLPPLLLKISGYLTGNLADPAAPVNEADTLALMQVARHGSIQKGQPISEYRLNALFCDGHIERRSVLEVMYPALQGPEGFSIPITLETTYARILQRLGREEPEYTVP